MGLLRLNPDYGYPENFRATVLTHAERHDDQAAAETFNVSLRSIQRWRKAVSGVPFHQRSQSLD